MPRKSHVQEVQEALERLASIEQTVQEAVTGPIVPSGVETEASEPEVEEEE